MNGPFRTKFNYYCNKISSWVNNPTLIELYFSMIRRADIEVSKSKVAMNAWLPNQLFLLFFFSSLLSSFLSSPAS
ncbi:MAG: hypothetical protein J3R72DRAFT_374173 [Linnemannia gamsii]|nr:MAG: hypothetical protein J3R72DRAFT_374173 [Linnemannia gamsii]